jgi:putative membrane protein
MSSRRIKMMMGFDLLLIVIVGAIAYAIGWRPQFRQTKSTQTGQTPLEILQARYAQGEISREEYEQMRLDLAA